MPTYDFKCSECECVFEVFQKYSDENPPCEECGKETERLISRTSFVLKGDGWYKDGYSKPKNKTDN
jgi:putative FmdB family regulatory protein